MLLNVIVVMDFIVYIKIVKDIIFVMLLEVQCRGYVLYYVWLGGLVLEGGVVVVWIVLLQVCDDLVGWYELGEFSCIEFGFGQIVLMCKDLLVDVEYIYDIQVLDVVVVVGVCVVNNLQGLCDYNEKLVVLLFLQCCLLILVSCDVKVLKVFVFEYG